MPAVPGSARVHKALPGFDSPAVGFESPFEMLEACHERVQRTLNLLVRLQAHVEQRGCDEQARQAAQDVMRYFDLAAPLHHEDEELHVFPAVLAKSDHALTVTVKQLMEQHREMEKTWAELRCVLSNVVLGPLDGVKPFEILQPNAVANFVALYDAHIRLEEDVVYPAANKLFDLVKKNAMGADMSRRRGAKSADSISQGNQSDF